MTNGLPINPAYELMATLHAIRAALPYIVAIPVWAMGTYLVVAGCGLSGRRAKGTEYRSGRRVA